MGNFIETAEAILVSCITCQQHNSGKLCKCYTAGIKGLFEQSEMDFIQLAFYKGFECFIFVCIFFRKG